MTDHDCPVCGAGFSTESSLSDHCWDAHSACNYCGKEFAKRESLYSHLLTTHKDHLSSASQARAESVAGEPTFRDRLEHQGPVGAIAGNGLSRRSLLVGAVVGVGGVLGATLLDGSAGGTDLAEHSAATDLGSQPTLGPPPSEAEGTIIAFEDPSCPSCARFERTTFPKLKTELVDAGRLSFVFRGIPVVHPWGEPAVLALEATYDRSADAFWSLKDFYYQEQSNIGTANIQDVTRQFLTERTAVDADAVIEDIEGETFSGAVDADLQASRDADVRGTPTFFLFKNGSFTTEIVGPQSFDVFVNSLGM